MSIPETRNKICAVVCGHFEIHPRSLKLRSRTANTAMARHVTFYLMKRLTGDINAQIALFFKREVSSVTHGLRHVESTISVDDEFKSLVTTLESRCRILMEAK